MDDDELVASIPIHLSTSLAPSIHLHQYPLLARALQTPPSAAASGKRIRARIKPGVKRIEVHVPADTRPDVWNKDKSAEMGRARVEDDLNRNQGSKAKLEDSDVRLREVRMQSEEMTMKGHYMLGIMHNEQLHLHPISQIQQFRPTLTYVDHLSAKNRKKRDDDSDEDEGPPPDPDDPHPVAPAPKKAEKSKVDAKEVQVTARKAVDTDANYGIGLSAARREILAIIRKEEDEAWEDLAYHGPETNEAEGSFNALLSTSSDSLECRTTIAAFLTNRTS